MRAVQLRWNLSLNFRLTNLERGAQSASAVYNVLALVRYMDMEADARRAWKTPVLRTWKRACE